MRRWNVGYTPATHNVIWLKIMMLQWCYVSTHASFDVRQSNPMGRFAMSHTANLLPTNDPTKIWGNESLSQDGERHVLYFAAPPDVIVSLSFLIHLNYTCLGRCVFLVQLDRSTQKNTRLSLRPSTHSTSYSVAATQTKFHQFAEFHLFHFHLGV